MTTSGHIPRSVPGGPSRRIALAAIALACLALSPPPAVALDHSGSITTDETWFAADNPHVVVSTVTVQTDVTLTIEDGAEVRFPASQRINVYGTLNAPGTAGQGIDFVPDTDDWYGLRFFTNGGGSFSYCELVEAYIGFDMNGSSLLALDHCDISGGAFGVDASAGTLELSSVSVSGAGTAGIRCIGVAPDFLDNGTVIENCAIGLEQRDVPGVVLDTPLVIRGATDAGLRLDNCPGALVDNVSFESCTGIEGAILAEDAGDFTLGAGNVIGGGATACSWPLTVNSASFPSPASVIPASGNTNNAIQVRTGSGNRSGTWPAFAGLDYVVTATPTVAAGGSLTIADGVTVRFATSQRINVYGTLNAPGTAGQGIDFVPDTDDWYGLRFFTDGGGSFSYCELFEAYIGFDMNGSALLALDHCDITGGEYGVDASAGTLELSSVSVSDAGTAGIRCTGVAPDFQDTGTVIEYCAIGLDQRDVPGVVLDTPLVIRGAIETGLRLDNCSGALVDNVSFENCTGIEGAILAEDAGDFTLGAGNVIGGGGTACSWPLTVNTASFPSPASVIPASGNTNNAIQVRTGSGNRSGTWPAFAGLDYVVTATPTVAAGGSLTIADGVTVRFVASQRINVYGTLNAPGTAGQGVDFVPDTDDWYGLRFFTNGTGSFSHCLVDGAYVGFDFNADNQLELVGVTIQNGEFGIQADGGTTSLVNCRVIANASYGIDIGDGAVEFGGDETEWNDIYGNGDGNAGRQLRNGPVDLLAANVYWGTLDYQEIKDGITDEEDDVDLGLVSVAPYLDEEHMTVAVGVEDPGTTGEALPAVTTVFQNHPNPFNPATAIRFDLRADAVVSLEVFDLSGRRVATLVDGAVDAGRHRIDWRGTDDHGRGLASGIYLYRFEAGGVSEVKRMTLVR